jgi:hypothetical protein
MSCRGKQSVRRELQHGEIHVYIQMPKFRDIRLVEMLRTLGDTKAAKWLYYSFMMLGGLWQ